MGWTINGYVPDEPKARLIPSTKEKSNTPVSPGWAAARQEQLNARTEGRQIAPNVPTPIAPTVGQKHGPAYRGGPNDVFSPQGHGVTGLKDVFSVNLPTPGVPRPAQPTGEPAMGGNEKTSTNALGVTQTMKAMSSTSTPIDMSRSFDSLLNAQGSQPFGSNQLPTTAGSPDSNIGPVADGQEYANNLGRQGTKGIGPVADGQVYGNMLGGGRVKGDQNIGPIANGQEYAESLGKGDISSSRLSNALDSVKSEVEMTPDRRRQMARAAFLDGEGSYGGLKARDAVNDVVYAGGQHYGRGALSEDGKLGDKFKIDSRDAEGIASGKNTAAGLLDTYKSRITESQKSTPAEAQDPLSGAGSAVQSAFGAAALTDRKLQGKSTARDGVLGGIIAGAKTDFSLNNSN